MAKFKRKQLLVNPKIQGLLVLRVIVYLLSFLATLELLGLTWSIATGPDQPTFISYFVNHDWRATGGRVSIGLLMLVPIVWDTLVFSNRFVGPEFRIRRILREMAQGGPIPTVRLRDGDYLHGLADDLNAALKRLASQQLPPKGADGGIDGLASDSLEVAAEGEADRFSVSR